MRGILVGSFMKPQYVMCYGGMAGERSFLGETIQKRRKKYKKR